MTTYERISLLEARIQALEELLKPTMYEQPGFIPDDKDAPDWANWKAMDKDGEWLWYSREPELISSCWILYGHLFSTAGKFCTNTDRIDPEYWKRSLMEVKR